MGKRGRNQEGKGARGSNERVRGPEAALADADEQHETEEQPWEHQRRGAQTARG
jgi:hypothetical protein